MDNASLKANLAKAFTGMPVQEEQVMDNPFPPMGIGAPQAAPVQSPSLGMQMYDGMDFPSMAKVMNLQVDDLHKSPELGRLQLMDRLSKQYGSDYMQRPEVQKLLGAYAKMPNNYGKEIDQSLMSSTAKGQRTLEALLGKL